MEIGFLKTFTEKSSNPIVTKQQQQKKRKKEEKKERQLDSGLLYRELHRWLNGKESSSKAVDTEDMVSFCGLGRSCGGGNGNPL